MPDTITQRKAITDNWLNLCAQYEEMGLQLVSHAKATQSLMLKTSKMKPAAPKLALVNPVDRAKQEAETTTDAELAALRHIAEALHTQYAQMGHQLDTMNELIGDYMEGKQQLCPTGGEWPIFEERIYTVGNDAPKKD